MKRIVAFGGALACILSILILYTLYTPVRSLRKAQLAFPDFTTIEKIELENNFKKCNVVISDDFYQFIAPIVEGHRLKTEVSVDDYPMNVDNFFIVKFYGTESLIDTYYIYKKEDKYYIEKPYSGIWEISDKAYEHVFHIVMQSDISI